MQKTDACRGHLRAGRSMPANVKPFVSVDCSVILKLLAFQSFYSAGGVLLAKSAADDSYILSIMGADLLPYF